MVLLEDEEIQKKGLTTVVYLIGEKRKLDRRNAWRIAYLGATALPFRVESIHVCYDNPLLAPFFTVGLLSAGSFYRVRSRIHFGKSKVPSSLDITDSTLSLPGFFLKL
jgi:hypothetical protein